MNIVEYYKLLKKETRAVEDFLIAAKTVSAGNFDVPARAISLIANDPTIEAAILKSFDEIEQAQQELRVLIAAAKVSR